MKNAVIKEKQRLARYQSAGATDDEKSGDSYAVNRTEDTSKTMFRAGKSYAIQQTKKRLEQKQFEKESMASDPIKAYGNASSFSDSFSSIPKSDGSASSYLASPVKTVQGAAKSQVKIKAQMMSYSQKTANNAAVQSHKKRIMRSWNRNSLLQKNGEMSYGSALHLPAFLTPTKKGKARRQKIIEATVRKARPSYLMAMGVAVLIIVIILLFSSAMAVIGEDEDVEDIPANGSIVEIAESQIGNRGGRPYWSWYGFSDHVDWCACFVSWCADQCGYIESGDFPKFSYCQDGVNWFIQKKSWYRRTISPSPGMIIFFDWDGNGTADHVGIVKSCKDNIVHTIEGNSGDMCKENWYTVGNKMIMGYGAWKTK